MGAALRQAVLIVLLLAAVASAGELEDARAAFEAAWKGEDYQPKVAAMERLLATGDLGALKLVVERALVAEDQFVFERALEQIPARATAEGRAWLAAQASKHPQKEIRVVLVRFLGG